MSQNVLAMLIPRQGLTARFRNLLNSKLNATRYPDRFILHWQPRGVAYTQEQLLGLLKSFEETGVVQYERPDDAWMDDEVPIPEELAIIGYDFVDFESEREFPYVNIQLYDTDQRKRDEPNSLFLFNVSFSSGFYRPVGSNHQLRFMMQKMVEILQPVYMWSAIADIGILDSNILEPWTSYRNTMIFGDSLIEHFGLTPLKVEAANLYYAQWLDGPMLWIHDPSGLGNEWPFTTHPIFVQVEKGRQTAYVYEDKSLLALLVNEKYRKKDRIAEMMKEAREAHQKALSQLLNLPSLV